MKSLFLFVLFLVASVLSSVPQPAEAWDRRAIIARRPAVFVQRQVFVAPRRQVFVAPQQFVAPHQSFRQEIRFQSHGIVVPQPLILIAP